MTEYELKENQLKYLAYIVLIVATILPSLLIYWSMTIQDDFDWTDGQLIHHPSQHAFISLGNGQTLVTDIARNYEITLPIDWKKAGIKTLRFELIKDDPSASSGQGEPICEIKTKVVDRGVIIDVDTLLEERFSYYGPKENNRFTRVQAGIVPALRIEPPRQASLDKARDRQEKDFVYEWQIPIDWNIIVYALFANEENVAVCKSEFNKIRQSFIYY